jgi:hypothetical protein
MSPPRLPIPPLDEILKLAAEHKSLASLARAIGVKPDTLRAHLNREGWSDEVKAALQGRSLGEPAAAKPVDDPDRLKVVNLEGAVGVLKKERAELEKRLATREEFYDRMREIAKVPVDIPKLKVARQEPTKPTESAIVSFYDQQFGQLVRSFDVPNGKGNFGVRVFDDRLDRFVEGVTGILQARAAFYRLEELWIVFGGDQVEGDDIFGGQAWQLDLDPIEQTYQLQTKNAAAVSRIIQFAKERLGIPKVGIVAVDGNHGKVGGKKKGATPATYSWDHLHHLLVRDRLEGHPIDLFAIEHDSVFFKCAGHEFQAIHGDEIKGWGGLPFYGLTRFDGRSIRHHNRIYRYLLMGHHHQQAEIPNGSGEHFVMGDWVGGNNLSRAMTAGSRPQQKVLFVSPKWGVTAREPVYFMDAAEAYEATEIHEFAGTSA